MSSMNYSFDQHWNNNLSEDIPVTKLIEAQKFLRPLFDYGKLYPGPVHVLDVGCGDGVHSEVISYSREPSARNFAYFGLDISMSALLTAKRRVEIKREFLQGDGGRLPFCANSFDVVFSFGALAYTDNPFLSFCELCQVTRPGGYIGVWIYPKTSGIGGVLFSLIRKFCQIIGPLGCRLVADCIVPFLGFLPTRSKLSLANASWRQCREVVLVNIAPTQLIFPTSAEVEGWFMKNNVKIISRDDTAPITIWGEKC